MVFTDVAAVGDGCNPSATRLRRTRRRHPVAVDLSPSWAASSAGGTPPLHGLSGLRASPQDARDGATHRSACCNPRRNPRPRLALGGAGRGRGQTRRLISSWHPRTAIRVSFCGSRVSHEAVQSRRAPTLGLGIEGDTVYGCRPSGGSASVPSVLLERRHGAKRHASGGSPLTKPIILDQERALLTEELAASKCGVSRPTFRRWVAARCIQPVLVPGGGSRKLYRREDVDSFAHSI